MSGSTRQSLHDESRAVVKRIEQAIEAREQVVVFGDYDVDGVTSTVQLVSLLRRLGLEPRFVCAPPGGGLWPSRPSTVCCREPPALSRSTAAPTPTSRSHLREQGIDVIVVDHHRQRVARAGRLYFCQPRERSEDVPWRLCTAGLVFKLRLIKSRREADDPRVEGVQLKTIST